MIIAGAKGFAKELLQVYYRDFEKSGIYFFDNVSKDLPKKLYDKFPIIKDEEKLITVLKTDKDFCLGVGTPHSRKKLFDLFTKLGGEAKTIISKKSNIGFFGVEIGVGCSIVDGITITNDIKIGRGTLINLNCTVGHDCVIGEFCDISPDVNISGHCNIGNYCSIGTGAVIIPGVRIGDNVIIGAGTVVTKDIPNNSLVVGLPGKVIKTIEPFEL